MLPPPFNQNITFLYTQDLAATRHFYEQILKLKLVRDQGDCVIFLLSEGSFLGFCKRQLAHEQAPIILTLVSDAVEAWYDYLHKLGVEIESPPQHNPRYHITHFFLHDPNGYKIEIQTFDEPLSL